MGVDFSSEEIEKFCQKWKIRQLSIFGSALRDDFDSKKSDIDLLYVSSGDAWWGWDIVDMREELETLFNHPVDLVSKRSVEKSRNPYRKETILKNYKIIYEEPA